MIMVLTRVSVQSQRVNNELSTIDHKTKLVHTYLFMLRVQIYITVCSKHGTTFTLKRYFKSVTNMHLRIKQRYLCTLNIEIHVLDRDNLWFVSCVNSQGRLLHTRVRPRTFSITVLSCCLLYHT